MNDAAELHRMGAVVRDQYKLKNNEKILHEGTIFSYTNQLTLDITRGQWTSLHDGDRFPISF